MRPWLVLAVSSAIMLGAPDAEALRRHALVVGHNTGLRGDEALRFAESDARRMGQVLTELSDVAPRDLRVLLGPSATEFKTALAQLAPAVGPDDQLIVYLSGHASDGRLHLGGTVLLMSELRALLDSIPAGVVLLVLDTCASGSMTKKGIRAAPGSDPVLIEEAPAIRGRVIIGASVAEGVAQESDQLGGSIFTQHLIAGLRGAADVSRDGRVTLQEAYAYASQRTLDSTFEAQRPTFSFQLAGERDLVLSEVGRGRSRLRLEFSEPGEWLLSSVDGGSVLSKFVKASGPMTLAVEAGTYRLQGVTAAGGRMALVTIPESGTVSLSTSDLRATELGPIARKGTRPAWELGVGVQSGPAAAVKSAGLLTGGEVGLRRLRALGPLFLGVGVRYRLGAMTEAEHTQHEVELLGDAGVSAWRWNWGELRVVGQAGALYIAQKGMSSGDRSSVGPRLGLGPEVVFHVRRISLALTAGAGLASYRTEEGTRFSMLVPFGGRVLWEY